MKLLSGLDWIRFYISSDQIIKDPIIQYLDPVELFWIRVDFS